MRWGIVGFGWVARDFVAPAILGEGHTLTAIADPAPAARDAADVLGARTYNDYARMLAETELDAVYVATPNHLHADPCIAALEAFVPVLCEKPMASRLYDAERIADAAARTGTLYATAFDQRHHPAHRAIRTQIADGNIGTPTAIRIVYACWVDPLFQPGTETENWRIAADKAGGGAVIDLALHGLDLTQMLLGEPLNTISVTLQRKVHDYDVDDGGMLVGRTASDVLMSAHVAYNCAETLPRRRLEVLGTGGLLTAADTMGQTAGGTLTRQNGDGAPVAIPFDRDRSPFAAQIAAFAHAVGGGPHDFSVGRDIALMRLFDAAHEKARLCH